MSGPLDISVFDDAMIAAADLSTLQYRIMKISADGPNINKCTAATDMPVGILQDKPTAANRAARVRHLGISYLTAGGTITAGDPITSDANGKGVTAAPSAGTNNGLIGYARRSAVDGDLFEVIVCPQKMQG